MRQNGEGDKWESGGEGGHKGQTEGAGCHPTDLEERKGQGGQELGEREGWLAVLHWSHDTFGLKC